MLAAFLDGPGGRLLPGDQRKNAVQERSLLSSRLHWHLREVDPERKGLERTVSVPVRLPTVQSAAARCSAEGAHLQADSVNRR